MRKKQGKNYFKIPQNCLPSPKEPREAFYYFQIKVPPEPIKHWAQCGKKR